MVTVALYLLTLGGTQSKSTALPTVSQIVDRSRKLYESCHTYQGRMTFTVNQSGRSYGQQITIKCEVGPKGIVKRGTIAISADQTLAGAVPLRTRAIDDGTTAYLVDDVGKSYSRQAHVEESIFAVLSFLNQMIHSPGAKVTVEGTKLDPIYVINQKASDLNTVLRISKLTGEFLDIHASRNGGGKSSTFKVALDHQIFNATIPPQTFKWDPPKEYKETKGGN